TISVTGATAGAGSVRGDFVATAVHATSFGTAPVTVNKRTTSTTVSCPASVVIAQSISCTVTVADTNGAGSSTPTGSVTFTYTGGVSRPSCRARRSCDLTISVTGATAGAGSVRGDFVATTVHATSFGTAPVTVNLRTTSTTVSCPASVVIAQSISCTVTVADTNGAGSSTPTGTVTFTYTGVTGPASCALVAGSCTISVTGATAGAGSVRGD